MTSTKPANIGLIGLSAKGSWASRSHLPYLSKTPKYKITALQNSSRASAEAAAKEYSLTNVTCHDDPASLAQDSNVDIVAVSVNVPQHFKLVEPALLAKKDIFVEWPLAANLSEAEHLTKLAKDAGVRTLVGLQARLSPPIRKAKEMVEAGDLGQILGTTMFGHGAIFGPTQTSYYEYMMPIEAGANLLTIPAGHAMDALCFVLGELKALNATLANLRPEISIVDEEGKELRKVKKAAHDHIAVTGKLVKGGGLVSVVYHGGVSNTGKNFYWEINGTKGSLVLEGSSGHIQMNQPTLKFVSSEAGGELKEVETETGTDFSYNVGKAWDAFAGAGDGHVTTFEHALLRHRMIDAIYRSDKTGSRESYI